jgi:hypothetical protein
MSAGPYDLYQRFEAAAGPYDLFVKAAPAAPQPAAEPGL